MDEIKAGDVVQLKSGGPNMTLTPATRADDKVLCVWIPVVDRVMEGWFDKCCLKLVPQAKED